MQPDSQCAPATTLRLYGALMSNANWGGRLVLVCGPGAAALAASRRGQHRRRNHSRPRLRRRGDEGCHARRLSRLRRQHAGRGAAHAEERDPPAAPAQRRPHRRRRCRSWRDGRARRPARSAASRELSRRMRHCKTRAFSALEARGMSIRQMPQPDRTARHTAPSRCRMEYQEFISPRQMRSRCARSTNACWQSSAQTTRPPPLAPARPEVSARGAHRQADGSGSPLTRSAQSSSCKDSALVPAPSAAPTAPSRPPRLVGRNRQHLIHLVLALQRRKALRQRIPAEPVGLRPHHQKRPLRLA